MEASQVGGHPGESVRCSRVEWLPLVDSGARTHSLGSSPVDPPRSPGLTLSEAFGAAGRRAWTYVDGLRGLVCQTATSEADPTSVSQWGARSPDRRPVVPGRPPWSTSRDRARPYSSAKRSAPAPAVRFPLRLSARLVPAPVVDVGGLRACSSAGSSDGRSAARRAHRSPGRKLRAGPVAMVATRCFGGRKHRPRVRTEEPGRHGRRDTGRRDHCAWASG
jgi:hypothetical protein